MAPRPFRRRSWAVAPAVFALAVATAACGSEDAGPSPAATAASPANDTQAPAGEPDADPAATSGSASGETATTAAPAPAAAPIELLSFSAPLVGGGTFDGAAYAAERPVAFWFWAPT